MATNEDGPSFFARYIDEPEKPVSPPTPLATPPLALRLLYWLQNNWKRPTICARDIYRSGPYPLQNDRKSTLELTELLEKRGWLIPLKSHRYDRKRWQITIGP